jgi:multidrug efflux pump subunit AcrA (membrane-fusion protein)
MASANGNEGLTLREAAAALGLSVGTVRAHIRAGRLGAGQEVGKYGPEYRIRPAVLTAFAADRLGLTLDPAALRHSRQGASGVALSDDSRELYERLLTVTEEATRYKALVQVSESTREAAEREYQAQLAELQHERTLAADRAEAAEAEALAAQAKAEEAAAELERLRSRGFFARVFGGNG